jgi:type IV pilus assembly protein PilE
MYLKPRQAGFTLIELLIAIVIVGILATIAMQVFWRAKDRGLEASLQSDLRAAAAHQEIYFEKNLRYATDPAELPDFETSPGVTLAITYSEFDGWAAITASHQLPTRRCGLLVGAAPSGIAGPAIVNGLITCGA